MGAVADDKTGPRAAPELNRRLRKMNVTTHVELTDRRIAHPVFAKLNKSNRALEEAPSQLAHPIVDETDQLPIIFQLNSLASEPATLPPDVALAVGVLRQAARDLHTFHSAERGIERELYLDAYQWIRDENYSWPYSFVNVCAVLQVAPAAMREEMLADAPLGWYAYWRKTIGRRVRSLRALFAHSFRPAQAA